MTEQIQADASATRDFFVDMIVRDISVDDAILDLIDNAVDAASADSKKDRLEDYLIDVTIRPDIFRIDDNCGGIPVGIARNYAFRFGRPKDFTPNTLIGEFGIGMKRAIFRLGQNFLIESATPNSQFTVEVDIEQWREEEADWTFPMRVEDVPLKSAGTKIEVRNLHAYVKELFSQENYARRMRADAMERYAQAIEKGLGIVLNKESVNVASHELLSGAGITPEHWEEMLESRGHTVKLRIIAGIGPERRPREESGWYVYCNGRLVLKADRTEITGWGTGDPDGEAGKIPAWHPQYARFRGFVFFVSDYPSSLPWTTTKTEIDETADIYRHALQRMKSIIMRYAKFTNDQKNERQDFEAGNGTGQRPIQDALLRASFKKADTVPPGKFKVPNSKSVPSVPAGPRTTNIQFPADVARVDELKEALDLTTNRQVGERAFERLYKEEIGEV